MPTKHPRINVSLKPEIAAILLASAKEEGTSVASIAKDLILEALERREDKALSAIAAARDLKKHKKMIKHDDAWK